MSPYPDLGSEAVIVAPPYRGRVGASPAAGLRSSALPRCTIVSRSLTRRVSAVVAPEKPRERDAGKKNAGAEHKCIFYGADIEQTRA